MVNTSKEIYKKIDAILSLPNWEEKQHELEKLMLKLDEAERSSKSSAKDARRSDR